MNDIKENENKNNIDNLEIEKNISEDKNNSSQIDENDKNNNLINKTTEKDSSKNLDLDDFLEEKKVTTDNSSLELLKDVPLKVVVELGRTVLKISELMELGVGSIIELNKLYGDPVDIYVNNKLIGKGEVVVIDEDFAVRITEIITNPEAKK